VDTPLGAGWLSPYAPDSVRARALQTLKHGAAPIYMAEGYGFSGAVMATEDTLLTLQAPGRLEVVTGDGGPAVIRVDFAEGDPIAADNRFVPARPSGAAAWGYLVDGSMGINLEPGTYDITVHRGLRHEPHTQTVKISAGLPVTIHADLPQAYDHPDVLVIDPHSHAGPSGDGAITMARRLMVHAAHGIQVHFGTDHDHVPDYNPALRALGLDGVMASVVADEVSPVLRGHFNAYPLTPKKDQPNNGSPRWWENGWTTDELFSAIREAVGPDIIIQVNHPDGGSGMLSHADYEPVTGEVGTPDHFSADFDAIEVLNDGQEVPFFPLYQSLLNFGLLPTPVGVSDSHSHLGGVGQNLTFLHTGSDDVADFDDDVLLEAMGRRATVPSRGPYLDVRVDGAWAPGQIFVGATTLDVQVFAPSFVTVDTLEVWQNGELTDTLAISADHSGSLTLDPEADTHVELVIHGTTDMAPVYPGILPWAATSAILLDADGDGWSAPFALDL